MLRLGERAFNTGDAEAIARLVTPDVQWGTSGSFPGIERTYHGAAGFEQWRSDIQSVWESFEVSVVQVLRDEPGLLVVEERVRGRGLGSRLDVEMSIFSVYTVRDGRFASRLAITERADALAAAG